MSIATPAFFWSLFAWKIFFQPFTFSLYVSPVLRWVSCRQHIWGSCFCIHSASLCLLVGAFNPFTFKVIIDKYKKDLHDPDNQYGVITDLEPDILECEVKWALESITTNKANGGDRIPVELFQILKDDAVKVLHSICLQIWKTQQWPQDWKRSVFIPITKKGNAKECSNYCTIALISHASKVMLKILQSRLQHTWSVNFQMFKLVLEKAEESDIKLPTSAGSSKKQESSRKTSISALLTIPKPLCGSQ